MVRLTVNDVIIADNIRPRMLEKKTVYQYFFMTILVYNGVVLNA